MSKELQFSAKERDLLVEGLTGQSFASLGNTYQNSVQGLSNEFLPTLMNQLTKQIIVNSFGTISPIIDIFMRDTIPTGAGIQQIENQLAKVSNYDQTNFVPKEQIKIDALINYLATKDYKLFELSISERIIAGAFFEGSIPAFNEFINQYIAKLEETKELWAYDIFQSDVLNNIKYGLFTLPTAPTPTDVNGYSEAQQALIGFFKIIAQSTGYPTRRYNNDGRKRAIHNTKISDIMILGNPTTFSYMNNIALPKLYHAEYLKISKLFNESQYKQDQFPDGLVMVMTRETYHAYTRIFKVLTQFFAKNMTTYFATHWWIIRGVCPWAYGFKYFFNMPTQKADGSLFGSALFNGFDISQTTNTTTTLTKYVGSTYSNRDDSTVIPNYTLGANDWFEVQIIKNMPDNTGATKTRTIGRLIADKIYNSTGTAAGAGPDNVGGDAVSAPTYAVFPQTTIKFDGKQNTIVPATETFTFSEPVVPGDVLTIMLFGYIDGKAVLSSYGVDYICK